MAYQDPSFDVAYQDPQYTQGADLIDQIKAADTSKKANDAFVNAVYREQFGRDATRGELDRFRGSPVVDVANIVLRDQSPFKGLAGIQTPVEGGPANVAATPVAIPTYEEFLAGAGAEYAAAFSDAELSKVFGPKKQRLFSLLEQKKAQATQDYRLTRSRTSKVFGEAASDRGLYGSGIYQTALNQQLDDLQRTYNRSYGSGDLSDYNQARFDAEQQILQETAQEKLVREGQAQNAYFGQYAPELIRTQ